MHPLLQINNLEIDFVTKAGTTNALNNITFTINRNEIAGVAGESGSGKSVTALSILKLLASPPARYVTGEILFSPDGIAQYDLLTIDENRLRSIRGKQIAMIFQEPMTSLNPVFTCGEQVTEAIILHENIPRAAATKKTIELFRKVNLPEPENMVSRYPHQLSGGQKQRVMIAMAMSAAPLLLICDEPTTALDVTVQKSILQLIKELQRETGMGVIFITHDLGVLSGIADKVIIMNKGAIVEQGALKKIFFSPGQEYTKKLLASRPGIFPKTAHADILIKVEDLSVWFAAKKTFGKPVAYTKAVDGVSFEVFQGETLGLVGESGCGKTTLGRALLRLIAPTSGKILFDGRDLLSLTAHELRKFRKSIQIIFQDPYSSLNPSITIGAAIAEPLQVHFPALSPAQRKTKVISLLEKVHLQADHYGRYPHEFSGGQRQRIVIARALALEPAFIICDESVSALDLTVQAQVLNLLNSLRQEFGFTSIFISHDLSVIRSVSDRVMVMNKGKIEEYGPVEEVYLRPKSDYTKKLLAAIPQNFLPSPA
ncbi:MAG: ABC transporter ATP-binding protein [Chitinophagaceae bacterium]|nr:ABC transporter ATP-binding protein [Chitinophagaceae bacterium]